MMRPTLYMTDAAMSNKTVVPRSTTTSDADGGSDSLSSKATPVTGTSRLVAIVIMSDLKTRQLNQPDNSPPKRPIAHIGTIKRYAKMKETNTGESRSGVAFASDGASATSVIRSIEM